MVDFTLNSTGFFSSHLISDKISFVLFDFILISTIPCRFQPKFMHCSELLVQFSVIKFIIPQHTIIINTYNYIILFKLKLCKLYINTSNYQYH